MDPCIIFAALHFIRSLQMLARVYHCTMLKRLTRDEQSSSLDPFVSYKENEVLSIRS
jgi:hypothetical protein